MSPLGSRDIYNNINPVVKSYLYIIPSVEAVYSSSKPFLFETCAAIISLL